MPTNFDFASLYPNTMKIFFDSEYEKLIRERNRQKIIAERRKKLEKICTIQTEK